MKLSTRGRYGLKAVVDLAVESGKGPISAASLANMQNISLPYLEQLMAALRKAEIVQSVRGAQGGYILAKPSEEITVGDVLEVLEGSMAVVECVGQEDAVCENACTCAARPLFLKLQKKINGVLHETTIQDMATDYMQQMRRLNDESVFG